MSRLQDLYTLAMQKEASAAELDELMLLLADADHEADSRQLIRDAISEGYAQGTSIAGERLQQIKQAILYCEPQVRRVHFLKTGWFRWAASIILVVGCSAYIFYHSQVKTEMATVARGPSQNDIMPGKEGAILTLADGSTVILDSLSNGIVAEQRGAQIHLNNGQLKYDALKNRATATAFNTMSTPRGRQFRVILCDGTLVWLNAGSSIRYPTVFSGKKRQVEITGEAYFEVAKDRTSSFVVDINGKQLVEVLGTHFNVNAYSNEEQIKTTLLEGSVRISNRIQQKILRPEEQAIVTGDLIKINKVNTDEIVAWKNGAFNLENLSLKEVMRQLERWYDIEVIYEEGIPDIHFFGKISRDLSLAEIIKVLEASKVHFRIEKNRKLVVLP